MPKQFVICVISLHVRADDVVGHPVDTLPGAVHAWGKHANTIAQPGHDKRFVKC